MKNMQQDEVDSYSLSFLVPTHGSILSTVLNMEKYFPNRLYWKWTLVEKYRVDEPELLELETAGWKRIDYTREALAFLQLTSQLNVVLALSLPERLTGSQRNELLLWTRSEDLSHAKHYPVILTYEATQKTPTNELIRFIPGNCAIICEGESIYRYEIAQLGTTGLQLLQSIMNGTRYSSLRFLASEAHLHPTLLKDSMQEKLEIINSNIFVRFAQSQSAAAQLSELYWQLHRQSLSKYMQSPYIPTTIPSAFGQAHLYGNYGTIIPATDGLEAAIRAMTDAHEGGKNWEKDRSDLPAYIHKRATSTTAVTIRMDHPTSENVQAVDVVQQLWERVTTYSDNDGDVLLAMLAQIVATGPDQQGGTWITAQAILDYRGILPKRHEIEPGVYRDAGHRRDDMRQIAECVERLRNMHVSVKTWHEPRKPGGRRRQVKQESYLLLISDFLIQTDEDQTAKNVLPIAWYYRPGSSLDTPLHKNAQVAWLLQQTLCYDPYREKWEKRLARYFIFQLRINNSFGGATIQRSISTILEESGLLASLDHINPARTRERFEKAMRTLTAYGHISDWSEALYLATMSTYSVREKQEKWLAYTLEITATSLIEELAEDMLDQAHVKRQITSPRKRRPRKKEATQKTEDRTP